MDSSSANRQASLAKTDGQLSGAQQVADFLSSLPAWYLATAAANQPHVRPFSFIQCDQDQRLWFCTATPKDVYEELQTNPRFEACGWRPGSGWLILQGTVEFGEPDLAIRKEGCAHLELLGEHYENYNDPTLAFFTLQSGEAWFCDIDGAREKIWCLERC